MRRYYYKSQPRFRSDFKVFFIFTIEDNIYNKYTVVYFYYSASGYKFKGDYKIYQEELTRIIIKRTGEEVNSQGKLYKGNKIFFYLILKYSKVFFRCFRFYPPLSLPPPFLFLQQNKTSTILQRYYIIYRPINYSLNIFKSLNILLEALD